MIDLKDSSLQEEIRKIHSSRECLEANMERFKELAETQRSDPEFALLSCVTFGTRVLSNLATPDIYGKRYNDIVLVALKADVSLYGDDKTVGLAKDFDPKLREELGVEALSDERPSVLSDRLERAMASEKLSERLESELKQRRAPKQTLKL